MSVLMKKLSSLQAIPMPIRIFQIPKIKVYHAQKTFIFQFLSAKTHKQLSFKSSKYTSKREPHYSNILPLTG